MAAGLGRRAQSLQEMGVNFAAQGTAEDPAYRPYQPQAGDVFIACWAKSGTTMMQQMFHQLRMAAATGAGDMDFDDISRMTPWEDTARICGTDMNAPQRASPRGFKSHREYERLPPGMRYVVTLREPGETYLSMYRFFSGWLFEPGAISLEEMFPVWMSGGPGGCDYATHLLSWYARKDQPDTLLATYRWAATNRPAMIRRFADFLAVPLTEEIAQMVDRMTSREFMHLHRDRFDDAMLCRALSEKIGIPLDGDSSKVQAKSSDSSALPPSVVEQIDAMWAERIAPVIGHSDFASVAAEVDGYWQPATAEPRPVQHPAGPLPG
jgi:hypothetical protein